MSISWKYLAEHWQLTFHAEKFSQHFFLCLYAAVAWLTARLTPSGKKSNRFFSSPIYFLFFFCYKFRVNSFLFVLQTPRYFHFFFCSKCRVIFISFSDPNAALFSFLFLFQMPRYFRFFFCSKIRVILISFFCSKFRFLLVSFHIS